MTRKSREPQILKLRAQGYPQAEIAMRLGVSKAYVSQVLSGRQDRQRAEHTRHHLFEPHKPTDTAPKGSCVAMVCIDGRAVVCGKKCKRQYCEEHKDVTRPIGARWVTAKDRRMA